MLMTRGMETGKYTLTTEGHHQRINVKKINTHTAVLGLHDSQIRSTIPGSYGTLQSNVW